MNSQSDQHLDQQAAPGQPHQQAEMSSTGSAIERWLASHDTSPKTNARLEHERLTPNHSLRGSIEQFQESRRQS
eukprot:COSAG01_NODE_1823_length_9143_cov_7.938640_8_plen_74_part_00